MSDHEESFEESFDVSHISHVSSDEEGDLSARDPHLHQQAQQPTPGSNWFASPASSFDAFMEAASDLSPRPNIQSSGVHGSPPTVTLQAERAKLRERKSGGTHMVPAAAAAAVSSFESIHDPWSGQEDSLLRAAVSVHGHQDWSSIAAAFRGARTERQCFARWNQIAEPNGAQTTTEVKSPQPRAQPSQQPTQPPVPPSQQTSFLAGTPDTSFVSQQSPPPAATQAAGSAPPKILPLIPKLSFAQLDKQHSPAPPPAGTSASVSFSASGSAPVDPLSSANSTSATALPSIARPSTAASGALTTRAKLTQFNAKLRAARRVQTWWRNQLACLPAKAEAHQRRLALDALGDRARGFRPGVSAGVAGAVGGGRLRSLKSRMAARTSGGGSASVRATSQSRSPSRLYQATAASANKQVESHSRSNSRSRGVSPAPAARIVAVATMPKMGTSPFASPKQRRAQAAASAAREEAASGAAAASAGPGRAALRDFPLRAQPALRAVLQGFLVRHQMGQRSTRELVAQIKDVEGMMSQVREERDRVKEAAASSTPAPDGAEADIQYATYFLKTLQQQLAVLKHQLSTAIATGVAPPAAPPASSSGANPASSHGGLANSAITSPSRIRFATMKDTSPNGETSAPPPVADSTARPATAGQMLKRKSQRRFLKRPQTAAAASGRSAIEDSWDGDAVGDNQPSSSPIGDSAVGGGGSLTSRSYLKRKSRNPPQQKLDWSRVGAKVDAKLDGYRAPGSSPSSVGAVLYDAATGGEWEEKNTGWGQHHRASSPIAPPERSRILPTERTRKGNGTGGGGGGGNQTARDAVPPKRVFKPSGNASSVLPISANTDSAAPPLSPIRPTGRKASRHIILEAKKLDLSKITSKVDYRSPYRAGSAAMDDSPTIMDYDDHDDAGAPRSYDFDDSRASPMTSRESRSKKKKGSGARPATASSSARSRSRGRSSLGRPVTAVEAARMRTGVTPSRDELRRLDEELARERREQEEEEQAWERHVIGKQQKQLEQEDEEDDAAASLVHDSFHSHHDGVYSAVDISSQSAARPPPSSTNVSSLSHRHPPATNLSSPPRRSRVRSDSDPEMNLGASFEAAAGRGEHGHDQDDENDDGEFDQANFSRRGAYSADGTPFSAHGSAAVDRAPPSGDDAWEEHQSSTSFTRGGPTASLSPTHGASQGRPARLAPTHPHRLSQQELLINAEIEDIERSLSEMSSFAQARKNRERTNAAAAAAAASSSSVSGSGGRVDFGQDLPSEWKRVVPAHGSATPLHQIDTSPSTRSSLLPGGSFSSFSSPRSARALVGGSSAPLESQGVMRLTQKFDQLAQEVDAFISSGQRAHQ